MERKIKGVIKDWSEIKGGDNPYVVLSLYDHENGYIFFKSKEKLLEVIDKYPIDTAVEFLQTKKAEGGKYWNYKAETFVKFENKTQEGPSREVKIVRQNALTQANEYLKLHSERLKQKQASEVEKLFFDFARKCELWVNEK